MRVIALETKWGRLTKGKEYEVLDEDNNMYKIVDDLDDEHWIYAYDFTTVEEQPKTLQECPFKVDKVYRDRVGELYTFKAYLPDADEDQQAVFINNRKQVALRYSSGLEDITIEEGDILPTPINVCKCCGQEIK